MSKQRRPGSQNVRPLRERIGGRSNGDAQIEPDFTPEPRPMMLDPRLGAHDEGARPIPLEDHPAQQISSAPTGLAGLAPRQHKNPAKRRSKLLAVAGYSVLALACIALTIATFLFIAEPGDIIREQLITRTKAATGRDLVIRGRTRFTFFPSIGVAMSDVSLSPPPGMTGKPTVAMKQLNVKLAVMPLLARKVVVERLVLTSPIIDLHVDKQGRKSWDFAALAAPRHRADTIVPIRLAQAANATSKNDALPPELRAFVKGSSAARSARAPLDLLDGLSLADVRIANGALNYADDVSGARQFVKGINLNVALKNIISPLSADGHITWRGEKISLKATLQSLKALLQERPVNLAAKISAKPFAVSYDGGITLGRQLNLAGKLGVTAPSLRRLTLWLGSELPPGRGFGAIKLDGKVRAEGKTIDLRRTRLQLDGATAIGTVGLTFGAKRPLLRANLQLSRLDLNNYLAKATGNATATSSADARAAGKATRAMGGKAAAGQPQVRGYTKRKMAAAGWDRSPIDLSGLSLVDANLRLGVGKLLFKDLKASKAKLVVKLLDGRFSANLLDMQLYGGRGVAFVRLERLGRAANLSSQIRLSGVSGLPLLRDAAKFERLDGRGNLKLEISGQGASQAQIVASLLGNGSFTFTDGAIVGFNIAKMLRGLQNGQLTNLRAVKSEKTDFSSLSGTYQITNGIVRNSDLKLISPLLQVTGRGTIALPTRRLDYRLFPKVVASLEGQGRTTAATSAGSPLAGLEIPVRIRGAWDNPKIAADFGAIAKDPNKALKAIQKIGKSFKGKNAKKALNELLGKDGSAKAKSLLNDLFR